MGKITTMFKRTALIKKIKLKIIQVLLENSIDLKYSLFILKLSIWEYRYKIYFYFF